MSMQFKEQKKTNEKRIILNRSGHQELEKYCIFALDCFDFYSVAL